jgi:hypothetical protein
MELLDRLTLAINEYSHIDQLIVAFETDLALLELQELGGMLTRTDHTAWASLVETLQEILAISSSDLESLFTGINVTVRDVLGWNEAANSPFRATVADFSAALPSLSAENLLEVQSVLLMKLAADWAPVESLVSLEPEIREVVIDPEITRMLKLLEDFQVHSNVYNTVGSTGAPADLMLHYHVPPKLHDKVILALTEPLTEEVRGLLDPDNNDLWPVEMLNRKALAKYVGESEDNEARFWAAMLRRVAYLASNERWGSREG